MFEAKMNLQDSFLNQVRKDNSEIRLILMDGTKLGGQVKGFDNFTVILASGASQHLVYKHAIAQIINDRPAGRGDQVNAGGHAGDGKKTVPKSEAFNTLDLSRVQSPQANS
ncbi:RNA chaperone Hfq [Candidatus Sumerlaeota bacterium]|nr:RNA chaperone Hfq [Candidatus Sumerlaeota bacterium]